MKNKSVSLAVFNKMLEYQRTANSINIVFMPKSFYDDSYKKKGG